MTDLEATRLCAEAAEVWKEAHHQYPTWTLDPTFSGITVTDSAVYLKPNNPMRQDPQLYDPLHDDTQAMALVKRFGLFIEYRRLDVDTPWCAYGGGAERSFSADLNCAIVYCVAAMQQAAASNTAKS